MLFLDTNIFLRLLTRDDEEKAAACLALFEQIETGAAEATTSTVVIAEICYVLSSRSHYQMQPAAIAERLTPLLHFKGLKLPHKQRVFRAFEIYSAYPTLGFEDALIAAHIEQEGMQLVSYDGGFDKLGWITRLEPGAEEGRKAA